MKINYVAKNHREFKKLIIFINVLYFFAKHYSIFKFFLLNFSDANILDDDDSVTPEKKKYDEEKIKSEFGKNSEFVSFNWNFLAEIFPDKSCANF